MEKMIMKKVSTGPSLAKGDVQASGNCGPGYYDSNGNWCVGGSLSGFPPNQGEITYSCSF